MTYQDLLKDCCVDFAIECVTEQEFVKIAPQLFFRTYSYTAEKSLFLNKRRIDVLFRYYGLNGYNSQNYTEIGRVYGISPAMSRIIIHKCVSILRYRKHLQNPVSNMGLPDEELNYIKIKKEVVKLNLQITNLQNQLHKKDKLIRRLEKEHKIIGKIIASLG